MSTGSPLDSLMRLGVPTWATSLVGAVCAEAGVQEPTYFQWRHRPGPSSSGDTWFGADTIIRIAAGTDDRDTRLVVVHELAHFVLGARRDQRGRGVGHDEIFWNLVFDLYARHGIDLRYAVEREAADYPSSLRTAARRGLPGASETRHAMDTLRRQRPQVTGATHIIVAASDGNLCATCHVRISSLKRLAAILGIEQQHRAVSRPSRGGRRHHPVGTSV